MNNEVIPVIAGLVIGAALVALFSVQFGTTDSLPPNQSIENAMITMERTPCFGFCPDYSLTIFGNGTVIYEGKNFVDTTGRQITSISREQVRLLIDEFYRIDFFSLKDEYADQVTDLPTTTTSIRIDNRFKQVIDYYGAPGQLRELEDKIDEVTKSYVWTGADRLS